jgi:hypothetical protein
VIFISHKLHEVMAIADRCVVLRHGKVVGEVDTHVTDKGALAALMVGGELSLPRAEARAPGPVLMQAAGGDDAGPGGDAGAEGGVAGAAGRADHRLAGVSGNGQAALAEIVGGLALPGSAAFPCGDIPSATGRPAWRCAGRGAHPGGPAPPGQHRRFRPDRECGAGGLSQRASRAGAG